jgi:hypothetical protein
MPEQEVCDLVRDGEPRLLLDGAHRLAIVYGDRLHGIRSCRMEWKQFLEDFQDHLAPTLDTYEQALYLYAVRHSRLSGLDEAVIGLKSARRRIAMGIGTAGKPMSEGTIYKKLQGLAEKGCLTILASTTNGTRMAVRLPREIPGLIGPLAEPVALTLEALDFFEDAQLRTCILKRESERCFYCLRKLNPDDWVIEHVRSRPEGNNSYRNVVASCRGCNNRKGATPARDFLRGIYRDGVLSDAELSARIAMLETLECGELRPQIPEGYLPTG